MASKIMGDILKGKLALVTGGGSGIGQAVCIALAKEGARVVVADVNDQAAANTAKQLNGDVDHHSSFHVDVGEKKSVEELMKAIAARYANVDGLKHPSIAVNCAGITRDQFLTKMDEQSFDDVIRVNLKGTFLVTQAVSKAMIEGNVHGASIINLASIVGKAGNLGQTNYAASKAGVQGLTRSAAKELAKFGIRVNAILPGYIDTPMVASIPEKVMEYIIGNIPLGRFGQPEDVAELCLFLASDRSSYITGASIEVTGLLK